MIYCISDIHGEYDRYLAMLDLIEFSDNDMLYVIGDVIDRKPAGIDILLDIIERKNVQMLLGNHEQLCLNELYLNEPGAKGLWRDNGGRATRRDLLYRRPELRYKIIHFLRALPSELNIEVNGQPFHLCHGYPSRNHQERIWFRPQPGDPAPISGTTVIVGHTPTCFLNEDNGDPFRIWYGDGIICIDCGCGNDTSLRRLACLRLDDMKEFYI